MLGRSLAVFLFTGYLRVYYGYYSILGVIFGLYRDNGKENGGYDNGVMTYSKLPGKKEGQMDPDHHNYCSDE